MYYLDPKNDVTFKKVFRQNPRILISFLNAVLPLPVEQPIVDIEYLNNEILPDIPQLKNSVVDIRCRDEEGRQFLVEMQLIWTESFESRILYNACKAFSQQITKGKDFEMLSPVYSLNIINQAFSRLNAEWYHHYKLTHQKITSRHLEGIEFVLLELPNFIPENMEGRKIMALWLRFLKEIKNHTTMIPQEILEVPEIAEAVEALKETSYSPKELEQYEKYWDIVRTQKAFVQDAHKKGIREGQKEEKLAIARNLKLQGLDTGMISKATGLDASTIETL